MEFFKKVTQFPFMGQRKVWYGLSSVLVVGSLVFTFMQGLNLGIDDADDLAIPVHERPTGVAVADRRGVGERLLGDLGDVALGDAVGQPEALGAEVEREFHEHVGRNGAGTGDKVLGARS